MIHTHTHTHVFHFLGNFGYVASSQSYYTYHVAGPSHNKSLWQEQRKLRAELKQKKKDEEEERKAKSRAGKGRGRGRGRGKLAATEPTETTAQSVPPDNHQDEGEDALSMEAALEERDQEMQRERENEDAVPEKKKRKKGKVDDKSAGSKAATPPKAEQVTKDSNTAEKDENSDEDKGESNETGDKAGDNLELELGDGEHWG